MWQPRLNWRASGFAASIIPLPPIDAAHIFVTKLSSLGEKLFQLMPLLSPSEFVWVSWPKKGSKVRTDLTEDRIRKVALPMGLVDVKVCASDGTSSGLKLTKCKALR